MSTDMTDKVASELKKLTAEDRERVLTFVHDLQGIVQTAAPAADRQTWNAPH